LKTAVKSLLLLALLFVNYLLVSQVPVERIDWSSFFPQSADKTGSEHWFDANIQYLFIELPDKKRAQEWLDDAKILNFYELDARSKLYLLIFDRSQQNTLLSDLSEYSFSGTSVIGLEIMNNFIDEAKFYALYIAPFLLVLLLLITSFTYWINMLTEIGMYHLLLVLTLLLSGFRIDSASLLALIFLVIYAFTLFNYLHSGEIDRSRLAFGIIMSIGTTALSSLFLYLSQFGLISTFGAMMLLGLSILLCYTLLRLYLIENFYFPFRWLDSRLTRKKSYMQGILIMFSGIVMMSFVTYKNLSIDLNPVNLIKASSDTISKIDAFEKKHLPSLPLVIQVTAKEKDFSDLQKARELSGIAHAAMQIVPGKMLYDMERAYRLFAEAPFAGATPQSYAQFLLASEMAESGMPIFSDDYTQSFITMLIPITTHSDDIASMTARLEQLQLQYPGFSIEVLGKIADLGHFVSIFLKEFAIGLTLSIGFVFLFFLFYCKTYKSVAVLLSTLFSLTTLLAIHALLQVEVTLMTLLSVILFAGLVTDSIIHIFICYKERGTECFDSVTKPIVLSNISMLIGLGGMLFGGSLMQQFGFELAILLGANLLFILYVMPYILKQRYF
jgi:predicted RND superfamily exporter protein